MILHSLLGEANKNSNSDDVIFVNKTNEFNVNRLKFSNFETNQHSLRNGCDLISGN